MWHVPAIANIWEYPPPPRDHILPSGASQDVPHMSSLESQWGVRMSNTSSWLASQCTGRCLFLNRNTLAGKGWKKKKLGEPTEEYGPEMRHELTVQSDHCICSHDLSMLVCSAGGRYKNMASSERICSWVDVSKDQENYLETPAIIDENTPLSEGEIETMRNHSKISSRLCSPSRKASKQKPSFRVHGSPLTSKKLVKSYSLNFLQVLF